jgi:hypothetical protein
MCYIVLIRDVGMHSISTGRLGSDLSFKLTAANRSRATPVIDTIPE